MLPVKRQASQHGRTARGLGLLTRAHARMEVRGLTRRDAARLTAHLLRLPPEDRRARFHGGMNDFAISAYVNRIDWRRAYVFGVFVAGELRGVAELMAVRNENEGEVAVSVESAFQHTGLGRLLVIAAMLAARRIGLARILLVFLARNTAMAALARDLGASLQSRGPVVEARITLPRTHAATETETADPS